MKARFKQNKLILERIADDGKIRYQNLGVIGNLTDWETLTSQMISYCEGKEDRTISSWCSRIKFTLCFLITKSEMVRLPKTSAEWNVFIKNWYAVTLTESRFNSSIKTKVSIWNKNIKPFLDFIQSRDIIPVNVIIPSMKKVGESNSQSSFNVSFIGESQDKKVFGSDSISKLIAQVSLSRSDTEYLDEFNFELERKRNKLKECLVSYWKTIKSHYDYGLETIFSVAVEQSEELLRLIEGDFYDWIPREGRVPPLRSHIAAPNTKKGFELYLYVINEHGGVLTTDLRHSAPIPRKSLSEYENDLKGQSFFPDTYLESNEDIKVLDRVHWCLGTLSCRDISYIVALLMMLNPKFNFESLLKSEFCDKNGKSWLEVNDQGTSYSIDKSRSKSLKTECLDDLSLEIIQSIISFKKNKKHLIDDKISKKLFITLGRSNKLVTPSMNRVSNWITGYRRDSCSTGYRSSDYAYSGRCLSNCFPSLIDYGLGPNTISHKKIRTTEGVLEWFKTGSVKAASRKLGNSSKVSLEYYIPRELLSAYCTRQVRRFQNLLIIAAVNNEDYLLEAVDFGSLSEINVFIKELLENNISKNNPLINHLKRNYYDNKKDKVPSGKVISSISVNALTALYLYRESAMNCNVSIDKLAVEDKITGISPMSLITLSKYLMEVLPSNQDYLVRKTHESALEKSKILSLTLKWENIFINKVSL